MIRGPGRRRGRRLRCRLRWRCSAKVGRRRRRSNQRNGRCHRRRWRRGQYRRGRRRGDARRRRGPRRTQPAHLRREIRRSPRTIIVRIGLGARTPLEERRNNGCKVGAAVEDTVAIGIARQRLHSLERCRHTELPERRQQQQPGGHTAPHDHCGRAMLGCWTGNTTTSLTPTNSPTPYTTERLTKGATITQPDTARGHFLCTAPRAFATAFLQPSCRTGLTAPVGGSLRCIRPHGPLKFCSMGNYPSPVAASCSSQLPPHASEISGTLPRSHAGQDGPSLIALHPTRIQIGIALVAAAEEDSSHAGALREGYPDGVQHSPATSLCSDHCDQLRRATARGASRPM